jgi:Holliday junction DNA helicase RuvA
MIRTLTGRFAAVDPEGAVIEVGGVGLLVRVSASGATRLPAPGEQVSLYTHLVVREDALDLYGFVSSGERDLFEALIGISGVGPRMALAICGIDEPDALRLAIARGDSRLLQAAPGVGKRTAERVVVELRDRLGDLAVSETSASPAAAVLAAREGLMGLGFSPEEADEALTGAPVEAGSEELVRFGLEALRRR